MTANFKHTKQALIEYDVGYLERSKAWDEAWDSKAIAACQIADRVALEKVQNAFFLDTDEMNSLEKCRLATLAFMRQCVGMDE